MISNLIWQTYKTKEPPVDSVFAIKTWINKNPEHEWFYMDDNLCEQVIKDNFNDDFYKMYISLPFGVMKSDVWRCAIIYLYGGIYADCDCYCLVPVKNWNIESYDLVIGVERDNGSLLNFVFGAAPKHPAIYSVLEKFLKLYNSPSYLNKNEPTPIQNFGQLGFSEGILNYYNINSFEQRIQGGTSNYYNTIKKVQEEKTKFFIYLENRFSAHKNQDTFVFHETASVSWKNNYNSWREEEHKFLIS
jgi:mannosyltransferase OCH1-like enzyme